MLNLTSHVVLLLLTSSKPHCLGQVTKSHGMLTSPSNLRRNPWLSSPSCTHQKAVRELRLLDTREAMKMGQVSVHLRTTYLAYISLPTDKTEFYCHVVFCNWPYIKIWHLSHSLKNEILSNLLNDFHWGLLTKLWAGEAPHPTFLPTTGGHDLVVLLAGDFTGDAEQQRGRGPWGGGLVGWPPATIGRAGDRLWGRWVNWAGESGTGGEWLGVWAHD